MGDKKIKKTNQRIKVWVCCACGLKDVDIISKDEALWGKKSALPWNEEEIDESAL